MFLAEGAWLLVKVEALRNFFHRLPVLLVDAGVPAAERVPLEVEILLPNGVAR